MTISALTGEGIDGLLTAIGDRLRASAQVLELVVPYERGDVLAAVHREGEVLVETHRRRARPGCGCEWTRPAPPGSPSSCAGAGVTSAGFVVPRVPLRPAGRGQGRRGRGLAGRGRGPVRRHPDRSAAAGRSTALPGWRPTTPGRCGATRRRSAPSSCARPSSNGKRTRSGVEVPLDALAVCVGTKEFVAGVPQWCQLRNPERDTVLYPAVSYPTYEMGALLAGLRAVPVPVDGAWRLDLRRGHRLTPSGPCCCGSTRPATRPAGSTTWPRWPRWGRTEASRCSATSATPSSPGMAAPDDPGPRRRRRRPRRGGGGALAVEAVQPGRHAGRAGTAGTPTWSATSGRCASTPASWCPVRSSRPRPPRWATPATSIEQRERYWERLVRAREILASLGVECELPARRVLPVGARPPAVTAGRGPSGWRNTEGFWCRRGPFTVGRRGVRAPGHGRPCRTPGPGGRTPRCLRLGCPGDSGLPEDFDLVAVKVTAAERHVVIQIL